MDTTLFRNQNFDGTLPKENLRHFLKFKFMFLLEKSSMKDITPDCEDYFYLKLCNENKMSKKVSNISVDIFG